MTKLPQDVREIATLSSKYKAHLIRADLTCVLTILSLSEKELQQKVKLSEKDIKEIINIVIDSQIPEAKTVSSLLGLGYNGDNDTNDKDEEEEEATPEFFSTGDEGFDDLLGGGVRIGGITEFVGSASSGKTNLSFQCALQVQLGQDLGGLGGGCIYLDTESHFASQRVLELARYFAIRVKQYQTSADQTLCSHARDATAFMDNIHVSTPTTYEDMEHTLRYMVPAFVERSHQISQEYQLQQEQASLQMQGQDRDSEEADTNNVDNVNDNNNDNDILDIDIEKFPSLNSPSSSASTIPLTRSSSLSPPPPLTPLQPCMSDAGSTNSSQNTEQNEDNDEDDYSIPPLPIKLLVLDSIAAPFRFGEDVEGANLYQRGRYLTTIGDLLHYLATTYDLAVIVVNHVTDVFNNNNNNHNQQRSNIQNNDIDLNGYDEYSHPLQSQSQSQSSRPFAVHPSSNNPALENWPLEEMSYDYQAPYFSGQKYIPLDNNNNSNYNLDPQQIPTLSLVQNPSQLYSTNQVLPSFKSSRSAALGVSWVNCINSRLLLKRTRQKRKQQHSLSLQRQQEFIEEEGSAIDGLFLLSEQEFEWQHVRMASLIFAPNTPPRSIEFIIDDQGVRKLS